MTSHFSIKRLLASAAATGAMLLSAAPVTAQTYPSKPIRMVVPFPPGGSPDIVGRLISAKLAERLNAQVVVDNRGGAGGIIGSEIVARAVPDGYTLMFISTPHAVLPALQKMPFDTVKAFAAIARIGTSPNALVVNNNVPSRSVKEFIAFAHQKPKQINFGAAGVGTSTHLASELFKLMANIDGVIVQYRGGGPAVMAVIGGESQALFGTLVQNLPHVRAGNLRLLGVGSPKRNPQVPDIPTVAETLPGFESVQWWGMFAPAGTPAAIVERLSAEVKTLLGAEDVRKRLTQEGADIDYQSPAEYHRFVVEEITRWTGVVKKAKVKVE
jgi:tripartite-type tricarboxylate transporter receptor subunit TctC